MCKSSGLLLGRNKKPRKKIKLNQLKSRTYSKIAYTKAYNAPHSLIYNIK